MAKPVKRGCCWDKVSKDDVRQRVKIDCFQKHYCRTAKIIGNLKENRTFEVRCIFWWEWVVP